MLCGFTPASAARKIGEDACSEPVYGLDAIGLATSEEAVHAHRAACRMCVRGLGKPAPRPRDVAVDVVLQLDGGGLRVCLCFEEGAHESRTLGEGWRRKRRAGARRGYQFRGRSEPAGEGLQRLNRKEFGSGEERQTLGGGVVEDEYDYVVCVCDRRYVSGLLRESGGKERCARNHDYLVAGNERIDDTE